MPLNQQALKHFVGLWLFPKALTASATPIFDKLNCRSTRQQLLKDSECQLHAILFCSTDGVMSRDGAPVTYRLRNLFDDGLGCRLFQSEVGRDLAGKN